MQYGTWYSSDNIFLLFAAECFWAVASRNVYLLPRTRKRSHDDDNHADATLQRVSETMKRVDRNMSRILAFNSENIYIGCTIALRK